MALSRPNLHPFFWPLCTFLIISSGMMIYGLSKGFSWAGLQASPCYPGCFCEKFHPGSITQPISSLSNIWYVLIGLGVIGITRLSLTGDTKHKNIFEQHPGLSIGYGILAIWVGLTSFFYHVSLTLLGRWADYQGMYAFASYLVLINLARLRMVKGPSYILGYAALNIGLVIPMIFVSSLVVKRLLFLGLILLFLALEGIIFLVRRSHYIQKSFLFAAIAILGIATGINLLDEQGALCHPDSLWQWHAAWHFLTAAAIGLIFLYFRSESD